MGVEGLYIEKNKNSLSVKESQLKILDRFQRDERRGNEKLKRYFS